MLVQANKAMIRKGVLKGQRNVSAHPGMSLLDHHQVHDDDDDDDDNDDDDCNLCGSVHSCIALLTVC